jgi:hypothetical protein
LESRVIVISILVSGVFIGLVSFPLFNSVSNNNAVYHYQAFAAKSKGSANSGSSGGSGSNTKAGSTNGDSSGGSNSSPEDKKSDSGGANSDGKSDKKGDSSSSTTAPSLSAPPPPAAVAHNSNPTTSDKKDNNNKDTTAATTPTTTTTTCPDGSKPTADGKCKTQQQPGPDDDCLLNPNLSKCKSSDQQCPKGFFLNDDDNCVPDKKCPKGFENHVQDETGTCYPIKVKIDCKKSPSDPSCPSPPPPPSSSGPDGSCLFHPEQNKCKPDQYGNCPSGFFLNDDEHCVPDKSCPSGFEHHAQDETGTCYPIIKKPPSSCPSGYHLQNGACTKNIVINVNQKVTTTTVDTVTKNVISNNIFTAPSQGKQPTFLLLLDTAQLCQIAGDTQCVAKQNQFKTLSLVTKLDSTGKTWSITGQAENIATGKIQRNVQVTAFFYDSKGNNIGGLQKVVVNPTVLKSLQLGAFNIKASTSVMKGTPSFLRLEYQSTAS